MNNQFETEMSSAVDKAPVMNRETPNPDAARAALIKAWCDRVSSARQFWQRGPFKRMIEDMRFTAGKQWDETEADSLAADSVQFNEQQEARYVANITLRHVVSRTASIYGKNPKVVAKRRPRMLSTAWDGSGQSIAAAMEAIQMDPMNMQAMAVIQDAQSTMAQNAMADKMARTLELMYEHEIDEQPIPFKVQMKSNVRRALTTGVGYTKLGFERVMDQHPDVDRRIETTTQQLAALERLAADVADGEIEEHMAEQEQLRVLLTELSKAPQTIVREGLTFNFPDSTAIIMDPEVKQLRGFVGAGWVAEEYFLTADRIKEVYGVDVSSSSSGSANRDDDTGMARAYERTKHHSFRPANGSSEKPTGYHCVWEIYNRDDGMVYVVCDGYPEFLVEPAAPDIYLERFFPWFPFVINEVYDDDTVIPPSDVRLMRDMQQELNRSRQGLREHRIAGRPRTYVGTGRLSVDEKAKITNTQAHAVVEISSMSPGEKVADVLQSHSGAMVDPRLYDPAPVFEDYLRTLGQQEANLGGTSGATATEAAIAEGSRSTAVSSVVDDLDEFLTELARAAGQVLLMELSVEKVQKVLGPGAVWPEMDRETVALEILLEIEAASSGRPNKAQDIQNAQLIFPLLMQIPGLSPEWMAKEMLRRMDDRMNLSDAFAAGMPSIQMLNASRPQPGGAGVDGDPNAQGGEGGNNMQATDPGQVNAAPRQPGLPQGMGQ